MPSEWWHLAGHQVGGRGDVTIPTFLWRTQQKLQRLFAIYHGGYLYWTSESGASCTTRTPPRAKSAEQRLGPMWAGYWASPILADGKLYFARIQSTYVVAARQVRAAGPQRFRRRQEPLQRPLAVCDGQFVYGRPVFVLIGKR